MCRGVSKAPPQVASLSIGSWVGTPSHHPFVGWDFHGFSTFFASEPLGTPIESPIWDETRCDPVLFADPRESVSSFFGEVC